MPAIQRVLAGSVTILLFAFSSAALAIQSNSPSLGPVPPQILSARTVFVSNGGGPNFFDAFTGGPNRGYTQLYADIQQWGRYQLVDSPSKADLIFEIRSVAPAVESVTNGSGIPDYNPQIILRILDPKTGAVLWTTSANVRATGLQASRDKGFDESVAVLVDRVRLLTGEQLTESQVKAVRVNSTMPRSEKILIGVFVGVAAGLTGLMISRFHNSNPSPPPAQPLCTTPPFCPASAP